MQEREGKQKHRVGKKDKKPSSYLQNPKKILGKKSSRKIGREKWRENPGKKENHLMKKKM